MGQDFFSRFRFSICSIHVEKYVKKIERESSTFSIYQIHFRVFDAVVTLICAAFHIVLFRCYLPASKIDMWPREMAITWQHSQKKRDCPDSESNPTFPP